jgi:DNA-binding NarL/FixJ family response regulator
MKVLLIDDDPIVCLSLKTILQAEGDIRVVGMGGDGSAALELYRRLQPDVLLMDIRMGEMTGLQACEQILEQFRRARPFPDHLFR